MAKRIAQSSRNAYKRGVRPAGRSPRTMPSGVSAATTVSSGSMAARVSSRLHDDRVGNPVVQTLPRLPEDEQELHDGVEEPEDRHRADEPVHHVPQKEDASERRSGAV